MKKFVDGHEDWQTRTDKKQMLVQWTKRDVPSWVNVEIIGVTEE